jgi:hypothetical protein
MRLTTKGSKHMKVTWIASGLFAASLLAACGTKTEPREAPAVQSAPAPKPKLGIRPDGDTKISIDMSKVASEELKKVFGYIDANIDDHVINLQKWIQQPSISNTGEGMQESAEMVKVSSTNSVARRRRSTTSA